MPKYFSPANLPKQTFTPSGRKELDDFRFLPDVKTGETTLQKIGSVDMYEKAQLSRPDDLYTLLQKCGVEPNAVESLRVTKEYANTLIDDFSSAPRTLCEAHEVIHRAEISFDQLPLDVKSEFDNSSGKMLKSLIDGDFDKRIAKFLPVQSRTEEVKDETK